MSQRILRSAAALLLAAGGVLASGPPASAATIYPPSGSCTVSPTTVTPGETLTFRCEDGTFSPEEVVTITVTGRNGGDAQIGMLRSSISTANGRATSTPAGALENVRVTLPADASGTYNIAAISSTSAGGTAAATIVSGTGLPVTGIDQGSLLSLWIGGGALVLAGAVVVITVVVRRRPAD